PTPPQAAGSSVPAACRDSELLTVPSREGARRGESKERGDVSEGLRAVFKVAEQQLSSHVIDELTERRTLRREATRDGTPVNAQLLRDDFYPTLPARQQEHHELANSV